MKDNIIKRFIYHWHDKSGLFCVPCLYRRYHLKSCYLKDVELNNPLGGE